MAMSVQQNVSALQQQQWPTKVPTLYSAPAGVCALASQGWLAGGYAKKQHSSVSMRNLNLDS